MRFAQWQYLIWGVTLAAELGLLIALRHARGACCAAVKIYLIVQVVSSFALYPLAACSKQSWYLAVYMLAWACDFTAQVLIIASVFEEIRGRSRSFGLTKSWLMAGTLIGLFLAVVSLKTFPHSVGAFYCAWLPMEQTLICIRNAVLILLSIFGWISGSSWPRRPSMVWLGLAGYSLVDYTASELNLSQLLKNQETLSAISAASFIGTIVVWFIALRPNRILNDQLSAKAFLEMARGTTDFAEAAGEEEN